MKKITLLLLFLAAMQAYAQPSEIIITAPTDASSVKITGPWWNWAVAGGPEATQNSSGDWVITLNGAGTEMEYLIVVDGVQEDLIDNTANDGCLATVNDGNLATDYWSYANRKWLPTDPLIYTVTYDSCQQIASLPTDCSGSTSEASEGTYSTGINYAFTSSGTDVLVSFELLDTDKEGFSPQIFIAPSTFINMDSSNAPTYTATLSDSYSVGDEVSFKFRGAYAGGLVTSRLFTYLVGGADCSTAGVEDISANAVKMYPNPANGVVYFSTSVNDALTVSVFDLLGKQVMDAQNVQSQLNISSLNPGMYFVKMTQGASSATKKLVVK